MGGGVHLGKRDEEELICREFDTNLLLEPLSTPRHGQRASKQLKKWGHSTGERGLGEGPTGLPSVGARLL